MPADELRAKISLVIQEGVEDGAYPGAVAAVGKGSELRFLEAFGRASILPYVEEMHEDMLFDLASLTKAVATTTSIMILVDRGRLSLDDRVSEFLSEFARGGKGEVSVRHLLTHTSGLADWSDLYTRHRCKSAIIDEICSLELSYETGTKAVYSDLGFIVLGEMVERVSGKSLDAFLRDELFDPLGMKDTSFIPPPGIASRCVPTEYSNWRMKVIRGEVHDENAFAMGGVSGHAGLFSTAADLFKFGSMICNMGTFEGGRILSAEAISEMTSNHTASLGESRGLGWLVKPDFTGDEERWAIAHNGYTGTSLAISPKDEAFATLLTNRVHPVREGVSPADKSVGIMMVRKRRWTDFLPNFYQLAAAMTEAEHS